MPGWNDIFQQLRSAGSVHDLIRRQYLAELSEHTGRNAIYYYSAWLEKRQLISQGVTGFEVTDGDKDGFMATIHGMDRTKGLDLILHTPGGDVAATESLVEYLRAMFPDDLRVIVPHLAMSAGTMVALSSNRIVMGSHSSLGPIDPQVMGMPAHGVVEEFERARKEITENPATIALWQPVIAKYTPTLIGECEKAIAWSNEMVSNWLRTGMFAELEKDQADSKIAGIMQEMADHALTKSHSRHIGPSKATQIGLRIDLLEEDQNLQEKVLTVHHAYVQTASETNVVKIIENQAGVAFVSQATPQIQIPQMPMQMPMPAPAPLPDGPTPEQGTPPG